MAGRIPGSARRTRASAPPASASVSTTKSTRTSFSAWRPAAEFSSFGAGNRQTWGTVDAAHAGVYGAWRNNGFYASGILSYDHFSELRTARREHPGRHPAGVELHRRPVRPSGVPQTPQASFSANAISGYGEAGYQAKFGWLTAAPFVGLEFASLNTAAFTETNHGTPSVIGLSYESRTTTSLPGYLGLRLEAKTDLANRMSLDVWARGAWKHEFDPTRSTQSAFISAPGFDFVLQGAEPPRNAFVTSIGAKLNLSKSAAIFGTFEGQFGPGATSVGGTGGIVFTW